MGLDFPVSLRLARTLLVLLVWAAALAWAGSLVMDGNMDSGLEYELRYQVERAGGSRMLALSVVEPKPYASRTSGQDVRNFSLRFDPQPDTRDKTTDNRGNTIITATWNSPPASVAMVYSLSAGTRTTLGEVRSQAAFPLPRPPLDVRVYVEPSAQVQSGRQEILDVARRLTVDARSELEAVRSIVNWIVDNIRYVNGFEKYDALSTLRSGRGNCQNFSHLAAALLRAVGIPVRIVNGITLDRPYDVQTGGVTLTTKMALGRHSWIEVWFPDLGWVPFDAQSSMLFVANRYLRCEVGVDNLDTDQDGRMAWIQRETAGPAPQLREEHAATFAHDSVRLSGEFFDEGPQRLLRLPRTAPALLAAASEPAPPPAPGKPGALPRSSSQPEPGQAPGQPPPSPGTTRVSPTPAKPGPTPARPAPSLRETPAVTPKKQEPVTPARQPDRPVASPAPGPSPAASLRDKAYTQPFLAGNLDYPQDLDFTRTRSVERTGAQSFQSTRNFLVESAEYVTTNLTQYAQLFEMRDPVRMRSAGLALHRYGGSGQLWLELCADRNGRPGELLATSDLLDLSTLSLKPGYRWTDFSFSRDTPLLPPGSYWLVLGFTGDAVVNWFYTYGKPVGPDHGTRYKGVLDTTWSGAMSYEFNYRIQGLAQAR